MRGESNCKRLALLFRHDSKRFFFSKALNCSATSEMPVRVVAIVWIRIVFWMWIYRGRATSSITIHSNKGKRGFPFSFLILRADAILLNVSHSNAYNNNDYCHSFFSFFVARNIFMIKKLRKTYINLDTKINTGKTKKSDLNFHRPKT